MEWMVHMNLRSREEGKDRERNFQAKARTSEEERDDPVVQEFNMQISSAL